MKHLFFLVVNQSLYFYIFVFLNVFFGALFGLFYSYRLFYNVFFDFKKARKAIYIQTNNPVLNDKFFSNTSLASNIAILSLFTVAYVSIIYLYLIFSDVSNNYSDFDNFLINTTFYTKNNTNLNKALNSAFINWVVIFLGVTIIFSKFRKQPTNYNHFQQFFDLILFSIFFYFSYTLLSY